MKSTVKDEILNYIETTAGKNLRPNHCRQLPCDLYDDEILTGFIVHGLTDEPANPPAWYGELADRAEKRGFRLIQIWEDLWLVRKSVIQSRLRSVYGKTERIFARKTAVRAIDSGQSNEFLERNHLQGGSKAGFKYGLFYSGRLVAVATFSKGRNVQRNELTYRSYELIRYCSELNITVVGGLDKLLQKFIRERHPDDIMTYADRDWSDGRVYENLGFKKTGIMPPQTFWVDPRSGFRIFPNKLRELVLREGWVSPESEWIDPETILKARGFRAVCNSGSLKYVLFLRSGQ